jgi:hypothetical protein
MTSANEAAGEMNIAHRSPPALLEVFFMDLQWWLKTLQEVLERKKVAQPILDAHEHLQPAIHAITEIKTLLKNMPIEFRDLITLDEDEWETIDEDELLLEWNAPNITREDKRYLKEIFKYIRETNPALYEEIDNETRPDKDHQGKTGETHSQKGKGGRRSEAVYDKTYQKIIQENLSGLEALDYYCKEAKIKEPDKYDKKKLYSAMYRRGIKIRYST